MGKVMLGKMPGLADVTWSRLIEAVPEETLVEWLADSRLLADGIPGALYVEVPDSGHLPNQECPEAFNRTVGDWLEGLPG